VDYVCTRRSHSSRGIMYYDGYLGVEAAMAGGGCEREFQHALTVEVEAWREKQLDAEIMALHVCTTAGACAIAPSKARSLRWLGSQRGRPHSGEYAP
jgi:hypothetical protein